MKNTTITGIISLPLIFLFLYTAVSKLLDFQLMIDRLSIYPYIRSFAHLIAPAIIICELIITILLLRQKSRLAGFCGAAALLVIFTTYLVLMINSGQDLPCSCGGVMEKMTWKQHVPFNLFFIVLAVAGIFAERKSRSKYPYPDHTVSVT